MHTHVHDSIIHNNQEMESKCPLGLTKCGKYNTNAISLDLRKKGNPDACYNQNLPGGHYAK
jgi:hypothetical protein